MNLVNKKIRIAVQKKGRLRAQSLNFLKSSGLKFSSSSDGLIVGCTNRDVEILFVRNSDIPVYLEQKVADLGIVGLNVLRERDSDLKKIKGLGFGKCALVIAVPDSSKIKSIGDLEGERIATTYPKILSQYLKVAGIKASIIEIQGSVEIAPALNLADAICDITQTGNTLKENGLKVLAEVMQSEALLVGADGFEIDNLKL